VSSNSCVRPASDPEFTSLTRMLGEAARAAGGAEHHFRVLQLPMNLLESGAALQKNNGEHTVLQRASAAGVGVLVNRPLNAIVGDDLLRLADVVPVAETAPDPVLQTDVVHLLEEEYRRDIASRLQSPEGASPADLFRWGTELRGIAHHVRGIEHWRQLEAQRVMPRVVQALQALDANLPQTPLAEAWFSWRQRYVPELQKLLAGLAEQAAVVSRTRVDAITAPVIALLPEADRDEPLARLALRALVSTPGVSCVLLGMRQPRYVDDALAVLAEPPLADPLPLFRAVRSSPN
jgi:hypothetical protein